MSTEAVTEEKTRSREPWWQKDGLVMLISATPPRLLLPFLKSLTRHMSPGLARSGP